MNDYLISMGLSTLFMFLKNLKGEKNKAKWRAAMLKLYHAIQTAYSDDEEFMPDADEPTAAAATHAEMAMHLSRSERAGRT